MSAVVLAATLAGAALLPGCAATPMSIGESARELLAELPSNFTGTLSCQGCPKVGFALALRPEGIYFLRTLYPGREGAAPALDEIGRWRLAPDSSALLLRARPGLEIAMAIADDRTLVVPRPGDTTAGDSTGRTLTRASVSRPFVPRLQLRGMYSRDARGARLRDCTTDLVVTVAREAAYAALDSAYAAKRANGAQAIMVHIVGRIETRPRLEDARRNEVLVVEQFNGVLPGDTCGSGMLAPEGILGVTWRLDAIGGRALSDDERAARIWLTIDPFETRVRGNGGCNRFGARARLDGPRLLFSEVMATKMACDRLSLETTFFAALESTRAWRVVDERLELVETEGRVVASFLPGAPEP